MIFTGINKVYTFYSDGFKGMTIGKKLWLIILIKLFVMFAVLKIFFFPNYLNTHFKSDSEKADHVMNQLLRPVHQEVQH